MCEFFFGITPIIIGPGIKTGLNIKAENPREVGADIIVNSVSAFTKYGGPIVVIDFGTATTFDVITEKGELLGVVIAPGIKTSLEGLSKLKFLSRNDLISIINLLIKDFRFLTEQSIETIKKFL
jgi:type III pantothenate kinase